MVVRYSHKIQLEDIVVRYGRKTWYTVARYGSNICTVVRYSYNSHLDNFVGVAEHAQPIYTRKSLYMTGPA